MSEIVATLFSCHRAVELYRRRLADRPEAGSPASCHLMAIDSFLMRQLAVYYPAAPVVVDFAAEATHGETTVFWLAAPGIKRVVSPQGQAAGSWQDSFRDALEHLDLEDTAIHPAISISDPAGLEDIRRHLDPPSPVIFLLAQREEESPKLARRLDELVQVRPDALILVFPLGLIGRSQSIGEALEFCAQRKAYRLTVLRELGPFFASCQLGLIYPADNQDVPVVLERIRQLFDGNLSVVTLARDLTDALMREKEALAMASEVGRLKVQLAEASSPRAFVRATLLRMMPAKARKALKAIRDAIR